ncbi:DNA-binding protein [Pelagophyceae sp. CCMP2097]|nr:DNA-binding protein [Pelagophyceae sp. CCMP2097]
MRAARDRDRGALRPQLLCEFFEVCIHTILCSREVYPEAIFSEQRAFGVPVRMSRHPDLNKYIIDVLDEVRDLIRSDKAQQLVVSINDAAGTTVRERFVFNIEASDDGRGNGPVEVEHVEEIEYLMRSLLCKLQLANLPKPRADSTFALLVYARDGVAGALDVPEGWIDATTDSISTPRTTPTLVPIKTVAADLASFDLFVECHAAR